jgi:hypothetical protein
MTQKTKDDLLKEIEDVKSLIAHLEEEYRKASISEKIYQELKEKYSKKLENIKGELDLMTDKKDVESKEVEKKVNGDTNASEIAKEEEKPKKTSLFGKLLKKKDKTPEKEETKKEEKEKQTTVKEPEDEEIKEMTPEVIERLAQRAAEQSGVTETVFEEVKEEVPEEHPETVQSVEIEKLKVMIDGIRDAKRATDETIQTMSESIGEIRSMEFQVDASMKETTFKLEKIEDQINEISPQEITKKFKTFNDTTEKQQSFLEKLDKKSEDLATKINKVYDMLKAIGGIENLVNLNKDIQKKIDDIKEAIKYVEKLALKTEKIFIDLNKDLEDISVYKTKQDSLTESVMDLIKSVDGINLRFENYPTKKDLEMFKGDLLLMQKQIEEINKVLPIVQLKLPETIVDTRKEKEDILLFLDSLEKQRKTGKISIGEYEDVKRKNLSKLKKIEARLKTEWEKIEGLIESGQLPIEKTPEKEEKPEEKKEEKEKQTTVKEPEDEEGSTEDTKTSEKETVEKEEESIEDDQVSKEGTTEEKVNEEVEEVEKTKGKKEKGEVVDIVRKIKKRM